MDIGSPDWIAAVDAALASSQDAKTAASAPIIVQYVVRDAGVTYRLSFGPGEAGAVAGAGDYDVQIESDRATAEALAAGEVNAQAAFMAGKLKIIGSMGALLKQQQVLVVTGELLAGLSAGP